PWRITVGPRGLKNNVVELVSRRTGASEEVSIDQVSKRLAVIYGLV
ncbi:MAG: proline--tRNA ligase, partial [Rhodobacteraceae bacterium]|nr:proline--tRNA ligase [Paracoccaceae bacterium]